MDTVLVLHLSWKVLEMQAACLLLKNEAPFQSNGLCRNKSVYGMLKENHFKCIYLVFTHFWLFGQSERLWKQVGVEGSYQVYFPFDLCFDRSLSETDDVLIAILSEKIYEYETKMQS